MKYSYKNISGANAEDLIAGVDIRKSKTPAPALKTVTVSKCRITNTYSASVTVDIFLEAIDIDATIKLYGSINNNYDSDNNTYITSVKNTYYLLKGVILPVGATLEALGGSSCVFSNQYSLKIQQGDVASTSDVLLEYEEVRTSLTSDSARRSINQY